MDFERAVSSSLRELGWEEMKKEQRQTLEPIGLDLREVLLLLFLIQKLLIVQVTALEPGWLWNREKQRCFETLIKTPISSPLTYVHNFPNLSLIFLTMKKCQTSFFWYCFGIFLFNKLSFDPLRCALLLFQVRITLFNNYSAPVSQRSWVQIPCRSEFFSGLIFTTA